LLDFLLVPVIVIVVVMVLGLAFWTRYKTVGPDEAMIVTGSFLGSKNVMLDDSGRRIKIVRGGGAFILPVFQQSGFISLLSHKLDVSTPEVYTEPTGWPSSRSGDPSRTWPPPPNNIWVSPPTPSNPRPRRSWRATCDQYWAP